MSSARTLTEATVIAAIAKHWAATVVKRTPNRDVANFMMGMSATGKCGRRKNNSLGEPAPEGFPLNAGHPAILERLRLRSFKALLIFEASTSYNKHLSLIARRALFP